MIEYIFGSWDCTATVKASRESLKGSDPYLLASNITESRYMVVVLSHWYCAFNNHFKCNRVPKSNTDIQCTCTCSHVHVHVHVHVVMYMYMYKMYMYMYKMYM